MDPVSRREFWDILTELHLQGITLVVSTPYMDEAERCSRVGLMYQGQLVVCDTPEAIKAMTEGELIALWPSDLRRAHDILLNVEGVREVQTYGDLLHVFVDEAAVRQNAIVAALDQAQIDARSVRKTRPRMEQAFISLVRRQEAASEQ